MVHLLLTISILANTFGLSGLSQKIDSNLINKNSGTENTASAGFSAQLPEIAPYPTLKRGVTEPKIYAKNYLLIDSESGAILAAQDHKERVPIASTTKIMTGIVVLENMDLNDTVTISQEAVAVVYRAGAIPDFQTGEKVSVNDLLQALLIKSSNVAANALAQHYSQDGDNIKKFIDKMNSKAKELGAMDTDYRDPAGLDSTGYSTAFDLYIVTKHALKNDLFADIVATKETTIYNQAGTISHLLSNSNRLVNEWNYLGAIGVKTGYMPDTLEQPGAGHTLVAAVKRDGHILISVVLKTSADTATASAEESRRLHDWGWLNTTWE